eukprot:scaffold518_cov105-Skeletonema_menzelii.AAC.2
MNWATRHGEKVIIPTWVKAVEASNLLFAEEQTNEARIILRMAVTHIKSPPNCRGEVRHTSQPILLTTMCHRFDTPNNISASG